MRKNDVNLYVYKTFRRLADLHPFRVMFIWGLSHMGDFPPIRKISETASLICFYHPQPDYPIHILLVPKRDIRNLSQFDPGEGELLRDLFVTVGELIEDFNLEERGYRLIVNGGEYQEYPQLHFHLVSGE